MMTLNAFHCSSLYPSNALASTRWPVDETGRNSVTPSTMPRISAISRMGMLSAGPILAGGGQVNPAGGEPGFAVPSQPFAGDGGERGRRDVERFEPGQIVRRHTVALEHQPLVAPHRRA